MFSKRGQNVGMGQFLLIVIGVLGLILVGLFVYNSWGKINEGLDAVSPEERTILKNSCLQALSSETLFCDDFKEVEVGKETWLMNCKYMDGALGFNLVKEASSGVPECESALDNKCKSLETLDNEAWKTTKVNGRICQGVAGDVLFDGEGEAPEGVIAE